MSIELLATSIADRAYDRIRDRHRLRPPRARREAAARPARQGLRRERQHLAGDPEPAFVGGSRPRGRPARVSRSRRCRLQASRMSRRCGFSSRPMRSPLSFAAGDLEWESRVVAAHHKLAFMERRMMAGDRDATELWKRYDREFHQTLIDACGSQTLLDLYAGVFDQFLRYQMVAVVFRGEIAAEEHKALARMRACPRCRRAPARCSPATSTAAWPSRSKAAVLR